MAKFYGAVGYASTVQTRPGIHEEIVTERMYPGDVIRNKRRLQEGAAIHDDLRLDNQISILADPYARDHFHDIRYVTFQGTKWKVSDVEVEHPRLILSMGGVYHG